VSNAAAFALAPRSLAAIKGRVLQRLIDDEGHLLREANLQDDAHIAAMSAQTGLAVDLLRRAIALSKMAHINVHVVAPVHLQVRVPIVVRPHVAAFVRQNGFMTGDYAGFYRSFFHALMQTSHEPNLRGRGLKPTPPLEPHPKGRRIKPLPPEQVTRKRKLSELQPNQGAMVNEALRQALQRRAQRFGFRKTTYCLLWILDAIDGLLPKALVIEPVMCGDLFPHVENYVIPETRRIDLLGERDVIRAKLEEGLLASGRVRKGLVQELAAVYGVPKQKIREIRKGGGGKAWSK
jgi:hypothetical protein